MPDNTTLNAGTGGNVIRSDDVGGVHFPASKITLGADNTDDGFVSSGNPMPVSLPTLPLQVTGPILTWAVPTFATITSSSSAATPANPLRRGLILVNDSSQDIYLSLRAGSSAVVGSGIRLNANGGNYEMTNANLSLAVVNAIAAIGSNNLTVHEAE